MQQSFKHIYQLITRISIPAGRIISINQGQRTYHNIESSFHTSFKYGISSLAKTFTLAH